MADNQRESFRIEADSDLEAQLSHAGRSEPCMVENLSAGGAKLTCRIDLPAGTQCTLRARLGPGLRGPNSATTFVELPVEVLESTPKAAGSESIAYRLRTTAEAGSPQYEAMQKLIFAAQRAAAAKRTGASMASPMVTDEQRHERIRSEKKSRFSKGSLRPGSD
jgi:hypothetical protein